MTIEQTVEIPASRRLILEIPEEVPAGRARVFIQFPLREDVQAGEGVPPEARGQSGNESFRRAIRRAYGAWKDNPWTNHFEDVDTMRDEWNHRDPWNLEPAQRHRD
jgi:hypothetical protein